ncbi:hypothetical protein [Fimbriiglobus ruber]|uniref:Uncharacterized protein n=1 Tax=Fimbriiglobus ruber TaxID=1908690 RepID=A0A225EDF7_9BACT|nr:hypothetical protein [Fimbriiglobus ruber]OWK46465.1 hypothetical protein FRUB_00164 [Fimbriiglobus ruber]
MTDEHYRRTGDAASRLAEIRKGAKTTEASGEEVALEVADSDNESYSTLSADRQQKVMLELRLLTGNAKALAYSYLVSIDFNPTSGIAMDFSAYDVRISGRNLRPLFSGLVAQRVAYVQERDELYGEVDTAADAMIVTKIVVKERS